MLVDWLMKLLLQECHNLYTDTEHGLVDIADSLGLKLLPPRKKITIMLIGKNADTHGFSSSTINVKTIAIYLAQIGFIFS